jgi:predicted dehydrogenase
MPIRLAVVGAGHLGKIHARLVQNLDDVQLVGVVDPDASARQVAAQQCGVPTLAAYEPLIDQIDAAVVAAPTRHHHAIVLELLNRGIHVLVEKPITSTVQQADQLIDAALAGQRVLQVGHVERFNPAFQSAAAHLGRPRYIEAIRASGYTCRSTDVGVVHDLMIHDLDLVLGLVHSQVTRVQALGISILGGHEDMAQARLEFENGCVANVTASRTSIQPQRQMQVFCDDAYASIDFADRSVTLVQPTEQLKRRQFHVDQLSTTQRDELRTHLFDRWLPTTHPNVPECNPLQDELQEFVNCVRTGQSPRAGGVEGREALQVAEQVLDQIKKHRWDGTESGRIGPFATPVPSVSRTKRAA